MSSASTPWARQIAATRIVDHGPTHPRVLQERGQHRHEASLSPINTSEGEAHQARTWAAA
ncbi:MAG: hypothetical protein IT377_22390 [Polyangiaceae bacterium]|nr:hypothetical protein [Polyangiaceae bacterium]